LTPPGSSPRWRARRPPHRPGRRTTVPLDLDPQSHLGKKKQEQVCGLLPCDTTTLPRVRAGVLDPHPRRGPDADAGLRARPGVRAVRALSTGDQLFVDVDGEVCYPGNSNVAPGAAKYVRQPAAGDRDFTISGGSGVFAGAPGSGTATLFAAGGVVRIAATGTLTLP